MKAVALFMFLIATGIFSFAQKEEVLKQVGRNKGVTSQPVNSTAAKPANAANRKDSIGFEHRDDLKDSINITWKYFDSVRSNAMDSAVNDFDKYFSVPSSYQYLGNNGAAAYSIIFSPLARPGWDAGFHAFDVYRFTLEKTKFYRTTKPYSQLGYQLASGKEQMIKVFHTQNPKPNWNFGFDYRLISAPGFFVTQNTNHNNFRLFSTYQGKRKRYALQFVTVGNAIKNAENGGITNDTLLKDENKKKRFSIPVNLGGAALYEPNPFKSSISTGNIYKDVTVFIRQSYDIGKKDSIEINDSTTEYLFYPKLRLQHSFTYSTYSYQYKDAAPDSVLYKKWYDTSLKKKTNYFSVLEKWRIISNDFSLLQFPDTKNPAQFFLAGATLQNLQADFDPGDSVNSRSKDFYNVLLHAEYRNKTRNKLWDVTLKGEFYLNGLNSGDYGAYATLGRFLNQKFGDVRLFFTNVNRTPSFIFDNAATFNFRNINNYKKENITSFGIAADNPLFSLAFRNHLITNYTYFTNYRKTAQYSKVINLLQIFVSKKLKISKRWNYYLDAVMQQTEGAAPIKVPLLFTRSRLAYEGTFFKNLIMSAGLEGRYYTPYKGYNYSPVMGQFMPQDTVKLSNLPDMAAFFHFRIKAFTGYIRAENLNTVSFANGFGFTNNNFAAPHYPTQGFIFRFGIQWGFVN